MSVHILVPIDFIPASGHAAAYAAQLGLQLKAEVHYLHVYKGESHASSKIEEDFTLGDKKILEKLHQFLEDQNGTPEGLEYSFTVREGELKEHILLSITHRKIDFVLMGTRSKHSFTERIFGTATLKMLADSPIPIWVIPEGTVFSPIRKIGFATDFHIHEEDSFHKLDRLSENLDAELQAFHINDNEVGEDGQLLNPTLEKEDDIADSFNNVLIIHEDDVVDGFEKFLSIYNPDLLSMFMPERGTVEQVFHSSVTKKVIQKIKKPLLVMKG
jgi:nucleotide-binding universal stress UspA family protein